MLVPRSTYRLQLSAAFGLDAAADVVPYLHELGADWVYLSPILKAERGSDHGYDVVDHSTIDPARGGQAGFERLAAAAHRLGLGVLVDIVPNHMGVATPFDNAWWCDVLTHGRRSRYAQAFDIDWEFGGGKVRVPVLGDEADPVLTLSGGALCYGDQRFPLAPGSAGDGASVDTVHRRQHYELINWRRADRELNYRRFFGVNSLAAVRVEVPWVFEASHAEIVRWIRTGLADGLRIDHVDGLADPGGYLAALQAATNDTYVLVEKILLEGERLPGHWPVAGTTGYDALADIDRLLVDPAGRAALNALDRRLRGDTRLRPWPQLIHDAKREIADGLLHAEVRRLERDLRRGARPAAGPAGADRELSKPLAVDAIAELLACFPVYRSYLPFGREHLDEAVRRAHEHRPDLGATIDAVAARLADPRSPAAIRFQQTSGMVMAKGVEDSAFYRYSRLGSLTEVGSDPAEFAIDAEHFHLRQQLRQAALPMSQTTLSTHDTKRGEDVRARIDVLAEIPDEWEHTLSALRDVITLGDGPLERLVWEAAVGAWPLTPDRLHRYAEKAAREAGTSTNWSDPVETFERRLHRLVDSAFDDPAANALIVAMVERVERAGWSNSLAAKLIQLTVPGVPDVYQGSELWELSLVDPDNRRPVDFALRRRLLAELDAGLLPAIDTTGAAKLLVTSRALRLRRDRPDQFTRYAPIAANGPAADHAVVFNRGEALTIATRLPIGLGRRGGWHDTTVELAPRPFVDVLTGTRVAGGIVRIADVLGRYPVALLVPESPARPEGRGPGR
jgi:(1->4)-alpha-D-glucan 1-alpha-D-glucosylmutase